MRATVLIKFCSVLNVPIKNVSIGQTCAVNLVCLTYTLLNKKGPIGPTWERDQQQIESAWVQFVLGATQGQFLTAQGIKSIQQRSVDRREEETRGRRRTFKSQRRKMLKNWWKREREVERVMKEERESSKGINFISFQPGPLLTWTLMLPFLR